MYIKAIICINPHLFRIESLWRGFALRPTSFFCQIAKKGSKKSPEGLREEELIRLLLRTAYGLIATCSFFITLRSIKTQFRNAQSCRLNKLLRQLTTNARIISFVLATDVHSITKAPFRTKIFIHEQTKNTCPHNRAGCVSLHEYGSSARVNQESTVNLTRQPTFSGLFEVIRSWKDAG